MSSSSSEQQVDSAGEYGSFALDKRLFASVGGYEMTDINRAAPQNHVDRNSRVAVGLYAVWHQPANWLFLLPLIARPGLLSTLPGLSAACLV